MHYLKTDRNGPRTAGTRGGRGVWANWWESGSLSSPFPEGFLVKQGAFGVEWQNVFPGEASGA